MDRNLLTGIALIGVVMLSSCSVNNKLADAGDDVYHTKAFAGDQIEYAQADNYQQNNYNNNDDYYYYGDYASRIGRFGYFSPFAYSDDFYYSYSPYSRFSLGVGFGYNYGYNYGYAPILASPYGYGLVYSPYNYGYYDLGGYDDIGYGNIYSSYLYGGGGYRNYGRQRARPNRAQGGVTPPLTFRPARTGVTRTAPGTGYYPGRPGNTTDTRQTRDNTPNTNTRAVRTERETRPVQPTIERASPSPSPSNLGGGNSGGSGGGGGGGRPVRQ